MADSADKALNGELSQAVPCLAIREAESRQMNPTLSGRIVVF
jgi:hypothetical protein